MMQYRLLATDYDGTIAHDGVVDAETIEALEQLKQAGRLLVMVTGRELDQLIDVCPRLDLFDLVVAENGAVLYDPKTKFEQVLSGGPSLELVKRLNEAGVHDISVGRSIIATWKPHEVAALAAIRDLGLELQIVFNKEAVMILPTSVNKASGMEVALSRLHVSAANVVGVGDAENDHAFIRACGFGAAVANAIPSLKQEVDWVASGERGEGVRELIRHLISDDLAALQKVRNGNASPSTAMSPKQGGTRSI